jgi:acyl-CoA thioesterase I
VTVWAARIASVGLGRWIGAWFAAASLAAAAFGSSAASAAAPAILVYGDSLSAAYGLSQKDGWVALLADRLQREKFDYTVVNASISGETTAGGASRIERTLEQHRPAVMIVALGSNDGLRGLPISQMKSNLATIIRAGQARNARVVLVGNRMPPNYGAKYTDEFFGAFGELAREFKTPLVPFILEPIAANRDLFQPDNLHPTAAAQPLLLEPIWAELRKVLRQTAQTTKR